jgi:alkylated DNA repair dioxygenase AlkB
MKHVMGVIELLGTPYTFLVEHDASRGRRDEVVLMQGRVVGRCGEMAHHHHHLCVETRDGWSFVPQSPRHHPRAALVLLSFTITAW